MTDSVIMGANWYVAQINCRKRLESAKLPDLRKATETFTAGGGWMQLGIPLEIEPLTAPVTMKGAHSDIRGLFGKEPGDWTDFYYYERLRDIMLGNDVGRRVWMRGLLQEVQQPRVTGKRAEMTTYMIGSIITYSDVTNGVIVNKIDFDTNTLILNGQNYNQAANQLIAA